MEPERCTNAGLVDLLDRVLTKGIVLNADVIISVAGVPLLGLNLRAVLAGMDTMLRYGIWNDWDAAQRAWAAERRRAGGDGASFLREGEEVRMRASGTHRLSSGIHRAWRPGDVCVTNRRIFVCRKEPPEILFEAYYGDIGHLAVVNGEGIAGKETEILHIYLKDGTVAEIHSAGVCALKDAAEREMQSLGLARDGMPGQERRVLSNMPSNKSMIGHAKMQKECRC